jgi:hypothetical protein
MIFLAPVLFTCLLARCHLLQLLLSELGSVVSHNRVKQQLRRKDIQFRFIFIHVVNLSFDFQLAALGGFLLMFAFFAFNGGSQGTISHAGDGDVIIKIHCLS